MASVDTLRPLVWSCVHQVRRRWLKPWGRRVSDDELFAAGLVGAWRALEAKPGDAPEFTGFAAVLIRRHMFMWLEETGWLNRNWRQGNRARRERERDWEGVRAELRPAAGDDFAGVEARDLVEVLLARIAGRDRELAELLFCQGQDGPGIARDRGLGAWVVKDTRRRLVACACSLVA